MKVGGQVKHVPGTRNTLKFKEPCDALCGLNYLLTQSYKIIPKVKRNDYLMMCGITKHSSIRGTVLRLLKIFIKEIMVTRVAVCISAVYLEKGSIKHPFFSLKDTFSFSALQI